MTPHWQTITVNCFLFFWIGFGAASLIDMLGENRVGLPETPTWVWIGLGVILFYAAFLWFTCRFFGFVSRKENEILSHPNPRRVGARKR